MKEFVVVTQATWVSGYELRLQFSDGVEKTVDFSRWLGGRVFEPLRDVDYFKRFFLSGGTVCWPNGADVAPETLRHAKESATAHDDAIARGVGIARLQ